MVASLLAIFAPAVAGTPIWTSACNILPDALASAVSSNIFIVSNADSTLAAALLVIPEKSKSSAPNETKPSGILIIPEAIPANADSNDDISLSPSAPE